MIGKMSRKTVFKPVIAVVIASIFLAGAYLAFMYGRFYNIIGEKNLPSLYQQKQFALENSQKEGVVKYELWVIA